MKPNPMLGNNKDIKIISRHCNLTFFRYLSYILCLSLKNFSKTKLCDVRDCYILHSIPIMKVSLSIIDANIMTSYLIRRDICNLLKMVMYRSMFLFQPFCFSLLYLLAALMTFIIDKEHRDLRT